jgi:hypothetical protein
MTTRTGRIVWLTVALLAFAVSGAGVAASAFAVQAGSEAGLVVQFPGGDTRTYCVPFEGEGISGLDLLVGTGLDVKVEVFGAMGGQVCKIDSTGCDYPGQPCACQSYGPGGVYWSYHHLRDGTWRTSVMGAGSYTVRPGDVEGWAWSDGASPSKTYTFEQLCPAAQPPAPTATVPQLPATTPIPPPPTPTPLPPTATTNPPVSPTTAAVPPAPTGTTQAAPPTATSMPAPVPTNTVLPTATQRPPTPTATPTFPPATPSPTATVAAAAPSGEDAARYMGLAVGAAVLGGLAIWGGLRLARGRQRSGGDVG